MSVAWTSLSGHLRKICGIHLRRVAAFLRAKGGTVRYQVDDGQNFSLFSVYKILKCICHDVALDILYKICATGMRNLWQVW